MTKRKSEKRFEQLRHLVDEVIPSLSKATHAQVLTTCWYFARTVNDMPQFDVTKRQIADATLLDERTVQRALNEMTKGGVLRTVREGYGNVGSIRHITGHKFKGETH